MNTPLTQKPRLISDEYADLANEVQKAQKVHEYAFNRKVLKATQELIETCQSRMKLLMEVMNEHGDLVYEKWLNGDYSEKVITIQPSAE